MHLGRPWPAIAALLVALPALVWAGGADEREPQQGSAPPLQASPQPAGPQPAGPQPAGPQPKPADGAPAKPSQVGRAAAKPPEIRGVAFPLHSRDPKWDYGPMLRELPPLGVNHILIGIHLYQDNATSPTPRRHALKTPSDRVLKAVIKEAHRLRLEVGLMPIVLLEKPGANDWRGNLLPPDAQGRVRGDEGFVESRANWTGWFKGYQRELLHYARLAQRCGVTLFSVGSELSSTEGQTERWKSVVAAVRKAFAGELTYSANWDHYEEVAIWPLVDFIGLSGYYELTESHTPKASELAASWSKVRTTLLAWRASRDLEDHPFLFTELGYPSIDGCASKPWDYTRTKAPLDLAEQKACYRAFVDTWNGQASLGGVFFYDYWGKGGRTDRSYTPRGKPALEELRRWYRGR